MPVSKFTDTVSPVKVLLRGEKTGKYVNEGYADISTDGSVLDSEGFTECSALIVQGLKTPLAYLAHVNGWNLSKEQ